MAAELLFMAFIVVYAVLVLAAHMEKNIKLYRLFWFGLLISVLYASVYSMVTVSYPTQSVYLVYILALTSLAIFNQYMHVNAVKQGRAKPMKHIVDVSKQHDLEHLSRKHSVERKGAEKSLR